MKLLKLLLCLILLVSAASHGAAQERDARVKSRVERAAVLLGEGRLAEGEAELAAVLKIVPEEAGALSLLGTVRAQKGKLDEAEALFLRAVRSDPAFIAPHMNLAYLYLLRGAPGKTITELKEVLRLDPQHEDATRKLARLLLTEKRWDECIGFIEALKTRRSLDAPLLVTLGEAYRHRGNVGRAEESYLSVLRTESENAQALLGLAELSARRRDAKSAARYLGRVREAGANSPELLYAYALVALKANLHEEARTALGRAAVLKPDDAAIIFTTGVAWLKKPDLFEAEQAFRRFLGLRPRDAQGQLFLGYTLLKQKRFDEASPLLEQSVAAHADAPEALYYLGLIAQERKEDARAVELLERVVGRFPAYTPAHVALGVSHLRLRNYERARAELEEAVRQNADDAKAHYHLALLYARLKETKRAAEEMSIVERLKNQADAAASASADEVEARPPDIPNQQ